MSTPSANADDFWQALSGGKVDVYLRYRFEHVEDDLQPTVEDAYANTLRTALGYSTGLFHGFGGYVQFEDVRAIGNDLYNDGGTNGVTDRAIVVDPEGTEVHQANLRFEGIPDTQLRLGRQEIEHRTVPLNRYLGNVTWRQNWQSFDAFRAKSQLLPATTIDYAYIWNVNRIFGEDNPVADQSDFRMDSHALDIAFSGLEWATLEPYAYLLDFESATSQTRSTATYGGRVQGGYPTSGTPVKLLYAAEFANQTDYAENPNDVDVNYYVGELGVTKPFTGPLESITLKASYEVLEGDGASAFQTPLGSNHAFQGWADRFLVTPPDGVEDLYGTLAAKAFGANLMLVYHKFSANNDDYDYGAEWDAIVTKTLAERYTLGIKYAAYDANQNATNLERNGVTSTGKQAFDLDKLWTWIEVKF